MSYVNLPPEATFTKLEQVIHSQRRLMVYNVAFSTLLFASSVLASLAVIF
jgi:hypothetical protein